MSRLDRRLCELAGRWPGEPRDDGPPLACKVTSLLVDVAAFLALCWFIQAVLGGAL